MIECVNLWKQFTGRRLFTALSKVDLKIERGELVSIVGPSGSGKSTLLNLIGGLHRPSSGELKIDGESIVKLSDRELTRVRREKIGFIFQFFNLMPSLSCLENVALPLHLRGWKKQKIEDRARQLLGEVGLSGRVDFQPDELSGGERQRVAIARAMAFDPPILLADEPTGNLDSATGADILKLIQDLNKRLGSTVLIVTHDNGVARSCPRMVTIRDSQIQRDERLAAAEGAAS
ncbi:MAG TPA: ABC transporter ATP-binding protein [Candidatus Acidoferrum sp.]|nr:ABC transporter ATP-binding protein [Candidatus Acidoferrum sp.]